MFQIYERIMICLGQSIVFHKDKVRWKLNFVMFLLVFDQKTMETKRKIGKKSTELYLFINQNRPAFRWGLTDGAGRYWFCARFFFSS